VTNPTHLQRRFSMLRTLRVIMALGAVAVLGDVFAGEPKDDIRAAARSLAGKANYTWTSETEGLPFPMSPLEGKTEKDGFAIVSQDMNGDRLTAVLKGTNGAVKLAAGWKTAAELPEPGFGGGGPPDFSAMMGRRLLGAKVPAHELVDLVDKVKEVKLVKGRLEGDLTEEGALALMPFGRGRPGAGGPGAPKIKATLRVWLKDGELQRYELATDMTMQTPMGEMNMSPTTTVRVKEVGTTKVEAPAEAKQKLAATK